ncbi:glycerophosphodiester phosphodiesterase family protein [Humidisolicoccus flavus]|uniref:glycerophosphodiester phosphodiesterase family protein n=1 Tax=Humidisolicoccus flavus TaxID=3111414 RepID=UPI003245D64A
MTQYLNGKAPRVFAHRGLALLYPENTTAAFEAAIAAGVEYIETDVRASADGVAYFLHDATMERLTGQPIAVASLSSGELDQIDLGHGESPLRVSAAFERFPTVKFNIDIKSLDAIEPLVREIIAAEAHGRTLITSFDEQRRRATVELLPGVASSASASTMKRAMLGAKLGLQRLVRHALHGCVAVQIPTKAYGLQLVTPRTLAAFHRAGVEVHVWTINDPREMRRLLDLGVDGIVSDRCDLAIDLLNDRALGEEDPR